MESSALDRTLDVFRRIDIGGLGRIPREQLLHALLTLQPTLKREGVLKAFRAAGLADEDQVSYEAFMLWIFGDDHPVEIHESETLEHGVSETTMARSEEVSEEKAPPLTPDANNDTIITSTVDEGGQSPARSARSSNGSDWDSPMAVGTIVQGTSPSEVSPPERDEIVAQKFASEKAEASKKEEPRLSTKSDRTKSSIYLLPLCKNDGDGVSESSEDAAEADDEVSELPCVRSIRRCHTVPSFVGQESQKRRKSLTAPSTPRGNDVEGDDAGDSSLLPLPPLKPLEQQTIGPVSEATNKELPHSPRETCSCGGVVLLGSNICRGCWHPHCNASQASEAQQTVRDAPDAREFVRTGISRRVSMMPQSLLKQQTLLMPQTQDMEPGRRRTIGQKLQLRRPVKRDSDKFQTVPAVKSDESTSIQMLAEKPTLEALLFPLAVKPLETIDQPAIPSGGPVVQLPGWSAPMELMSNPCEVAPTAPPPAPMQSSGAESGGGPLPLQNPDLPFLAENQRKFKSTSGPLKYVEEELETECEGLVRSPRPAENGWMFFHLTDELQGRIASKASSSKSPGTTSKASNDLSIRSRTASFSVNTFSRTLSITRDDARSTSKNVLSKIENRRPCSKPVPRLDEEQEVCSPLVVDEAEKDGQPMASSPQAPVSWQLWLGMAIGRNQARSCPRLQG